jgi:hypothetical protein
VFTPPPPLLLGRNTNPQLIYPTPSVFAASSRQQLQEHNIVRIVSVLRRHETSRSLNARLAYIDIDTEADRDEAGHPTARPGPEIKVLDLDDDPLVDILEWLGETCDWIQEGLDAKVNVQKMSDRAAEGVRPGVLVHCKLGISRSGAFIVGFCKFSLVVLASVLVVTLALLCLSTPTPVQLCKLTYRSANRMGLSASLSVSAG